MTAASQWVFLLKSLEGRSWSADPFLTGEGRCRVGSNGHVHHTSRRGRGPSTRGKMCRDNVGKDHVAAGARSNLPLLVNPRYGRLSERHERRPLARSPDRQRGGDALAGKYCRRTCQNRLTTHTKGTLRKSRKETGNVDKAVHTTSWHGPGRHAHATGRTGSGVRA